MRFAITFEPPVEAASSFEKDPKAAEFFARLLEQAKPEAGYFSSSRRWMILIVKAESHEELTKLVQFNHTILWHTFKVYPQVEPVVSIEEFKTILPKLSEFTKGL